MKTRAGTALAAHHRHRTWNTPSMAIQMDLYLVGLYLYTKITFYSSQRLLICKTLSCAIQIWASVLTPKSSGTCWLWVQSQSSSLCTSMGKYFCNMDTKPQPLALLVALPLVPVWPLFTLAAGCSPLTLARTWKVRPERKLKILMKIHLSTILSFQIGMTFFLLQSMKEDILMYVCNRATAVPIHFYCMEYNGYHRYLVTKIF